MVQNETMKLLSLSYVDYRAGSKVQGPTRPHPRMGFRPKVELPWAFVGPNINMAILGICISSVDFPSVNYL